MNSKEISLINNFDNVAGYIRPNNVFESIVPPLSPGDETRGINIGSDTFGNNTEFQIIDDTFNFNYNSIPSASITSSGISTVNLA
jgi:hypothetical protein